MSSTDGTVNGSSGSEQYDATKTEFLYKTLKENVQEIASKMMKCSQIFQDLAEDMDNVSKSVTVVQDHYLAAKNVPELDKTTC